MEELHKIRNQTRNVVFLDIDDIGYLGSRTKADQFAFCEGAMHEFAPFRALMDKSLKNRLQQAISKLPEKLKMVLSLYYFSELNYKEIGQILKLSESRISQLHSKAVLKLRKTLQMQDKMDEM